MDSASLKMAFSRFIVGPNVSALVFPRTSINLAVISKKPCSAVKSVPPTSMALLLASLLICLCQGKMRIEAEVISESLFSYDKAIPEERIEKPVGLSLDEKEIGSNLQCTDCQAKGAVLCTTCYGSGLCVDFILESQGIIVKVRCLGCGGTGNMMCTVCGG